MLISLLIFLLVSNAVTLRRDKSILFSRVVIKSLRFASFIYFNNNLFTPFIGFSTVGFNPSSITINSALSSTIYILTLLFILFIYIPGEWFNVVSILTLISIKA